MDDGPGGAAHAPSTIKFDWVLYGSGEPTKGRGYVAASRCSLFPDLPCLWQEQSVLIVMLRAKSRVQARYQETRPERMLATCTVAQVNSAGRHAWQPKQCMYFKIKSAWPHSYLGTIRRSPSNAACNKIIIMSCPDEQTAYLKEAGSVHFRITGDYSGGLTGEIWDSRMGVAGSRQLATCVCTDSWSVLS